MPNTRRRRFSVQNDQTRQKPHRTRSNNNNNNSGKKPPVSTSLGEENGSRNKIRPNSSKETRTTTLTEKGESTASLVVSRLARSGRADKDVAATSSNIDLYHYQSLPEHTTLLPAADVEPREEEVGADSAGECAVQDGGVGECAEEMCRICHGVSGRLVSTCRCRGSVGRVHVRCLERWLSAAGRARCELCHQRYTTRRVHRYGLPRALLVWLFTHSAKQLMVDGLGLVLMSPLALLAAWLAGRTLAALTAPPSLPSPPWPTASTFVLACMTLVCYYCWVVSAATRHALSWWSWYRAHYHVKLQLDSEQEQEYEHT